MDKQVTDPEVNSLSSVSGQNQLLQNQSEQGLFLAQLPGFQLLPRGSVGQDQRGPSTSKGQRGRKPWDRHSSVGKQRENQSCRHGSHKP